MSLFFFLCRTPCCAFVRTLAMLRIFSLALLSFWLFIICPYSWKAGLFFQDLTFNFYVYLRVFAHINVHVWFGAWFMCMYMCLLGMNVHVWVGTLFMCMYTCLHVWMWLYELMPYLCVCTCLYECACMIWCLIYVYLHVFAHIHVHVWFSTLFMCMYTYLHV